MDVRVKGLRVDKGKVVEYERIDHIPDEKMRDNLLCTDCGVPDYPKCQETCVHYKNLLALENK